jgi:hypothetical protein
MMRAILIPPQKISSFTRIKQHPNFMLDRSSAAEPPEINENTKQHLNSINRKL